MTTQLAVSNLLLEIRSDLKNYGTRDDGHPFIGEEYYVVAIDKTGNVYRHWRNFPGAAKDFNIETGETFFVDTREHAETRCQELINRITHHGSIDLSCWNMTRPVYGSEAYSRYSREEYLEDLME